MKNQIPNMSGVGYVVLYPRPTQHPSVEPIPFGIVSDITQTSAILKELADQWKNTKPGRKAFVDGASCLCEFSDGKQAALYTVESDGTLTEDMKLKFVVLLLTKLFG